MRFFGILLAVFVSTSFSGAAEPGSPDPRPVPVVLSCAEAAAIYHSTYKEEMSRGGLESVARAILEQAVQTRRIPGASIAFGDGSGISLALSRGTLSLENATPVNSETLYDLASMTKVIATATAIMILRERGLLSLSSPLQEYLPEFAKAGFGKVPLERFLRHRAGIRDVALPAKHWWRNAKKAYLSKLLKDGLVPDPSQRQRFSYTDAAYILLGEVVERVSGLRLDAFARLEIFEPLGMKRTGYLPPVGSVCARALRSCRPHDPLAYAFGGVAGNAGVFSTATEVALFAQMILNRGLLVDRQGRQRQFLSTDSIRFMTSDPEHSVDLRGLGFDIDTAYSCAPRGDFSRESFGHTGYTGTSLWIDPLAHKFLVLLTNEVDIAKGPISAIRWCLAKSAADEGRF
ncbi:MAG TPA: hypothetical protein DCS07_05315 [Bdellovibrionales bacterium]|nr:MAG: hypothetical protein A2Z97_03080 [Bdellovibrionales bacterium GWB1_52_6]OFZ06353.1 MAG: hypothetical protein A2X97_02725 [Bdellovibrionales bacterium GWA1_52_35]OFZ36576.1 MAG: hypothetical protein A2070_09550 [Bdellovibrionales bacterium GWC1_52_8]HAR42037.1 hypothetical protein [Bdellovibrionales bacterium]HCM40106.1 hypothetical protein [Bdellovibrionales bacterium]